MKKLILVTALAVAASWLLSEPRRPDNRADRLDVALRDAVQERLVSDEAPRPPQPPDEPGSIRTIPWRQARERGKAEVPAPKVLKTSKVRPMPSWFPKTEEEEQAKARIDAFGSRVLLGRLSASEDRARKDVREIVEREVASWLSADVPPSWKVPSRVIDDMVKGSFTQETTKNLLPKETPEASEDPGVGGLYTLYRTGQKLDFSPSRRAEIIGMYRRDVAAARMQRLGGGLALALVGLAVLSGYIKADEATKGYYTNRLRLLAAAGLGAAGVAAYRFLA